MVIEWPGKLVYTKACFALDMAVGGKHLLPTAADITGAPKEYRELERVAVRLIDAKADRYEGDLPIAQESGDHVPDEQSGEENDWVLQNPRAAQGKNEAGNLGRSVRRSETIFGMGGSGSETRNRFQETGHRWGDFPGSLVAM